MSRPSHLRVLSNAPRIGAGVPRLSRVGPTPAEPDRARTILLCGGESRELGWIRTALDARTYRIERLPSLDALRTGMPRRLGTVLLLSVRGLGTSSALEFVRRLDRSTRRRVIVLTRMGDDLQPFADAGVGDFVRLPATASELAMRVDLRIRDALYRHAEPDAGLEAGMFLSQPGRDPMAPTLTPRELRLYALLVERFGCVVSRAEILERVWGRDGQTSNVSDVYIRYLRVKLAKLAPFVAIRTVRHRGYVLEWSDGGR